MAEAYVHVIVDPGAVSRAASAISELESAASVHVVTGEYDVIARLELEDVSDLPTVVAEEIHPITGVIDTVTSLAFER
ncbi:Lrp/AsnC family transcriptional regulator [Natronorarus salvus]|uniref:Lrp/AsnC family transcriptional regulator n=1 Tax=Natronorarus salvus TaxID=3117733 RepID=UPI002F266972